VESILTSFLSSSVNINVLINIKFDTCCIITRIKCDTTDIVLFCNFVFRYDKSKTYHTHLNVNIVYDSFKKILTGFYSTFRLRRSVNSCES
jgi:hypothetical protein